MSTLAMESGRTTRFVDLLLTALLAAPLVFSSYASAAKPELPRIVVTALDARAAEAGPDAGTFLLTRTGGDIDEPIVVGILLSGTAKPGADYAAPTAPFFA